MMGAPRTYRNHAPAIASNAGIQFDQNAFFVVRVTRDQLIGAVATVANCSMEASVVTAYKVAEEKSDNTIELFQDRLIELFSKQYVSKDVEIMGASATPWHVAASVRVHDRVSLFDVVSAHPNSIAAAVTKFVDIAELIDPPKRVAVVRDRTKLGTRLTVLQRTADVIEVASPDTIIRRIAQAA